MHRWDPPTSPTSPAGRACCGCSAAAAPRPRVALVVLLQQRRHDALHKHVNLQHLQAERVGSNVACQAWQVGRWMQQGRKQRTVHSTARHSSLWSKHSTQRHARSDAFEAKSTSAAIRSAAGGRTCVVYCSAATKGASTSASSQTRRDLQGRRQERQERSGRGQFGWTCGPCCSCGLLLWPPLRCCCWLLLWAAPLHQHAASASAPPPACGTSDQPRHTAAPVKRVWVLGGQIEYAHQPLLHIHRRGSHGARAALIQRAPVGKVGASVVAGQSEGGAGWS